jgi:hypothetical protein
MILLPLAASAQAPIDRVDIILWPEFDRPETLVIYRIHLAPGTSLPAKVRVPIPAAVGEPHAVAFTAETGELLVAPYERVVEGDWGVITLETLTLEAQVEYYVPYQEVDGRRQVEIRWPPGFPVGSLGYEVQQPPTATDLRIDPQPNRSEQGGDGLLYYYGELAPLEDGAQLSLSYHKTDNLLTVEAFGTPEPVSLTMPEATAGGTPDLAVIVPWLVGSLGILLLVAGALLFIRASRPAAAKAKPRRRKARAAPKPPASEEAPPVFCHQCGTPANASDRFCRQCGTRLRT